MKMRKNIKQMLKDGDQRRLSTIQLIDNDFEELLLKFDEVKQSVATDATKSLSKSCNDVASPTLEVKTFGIKNSNER